MPARPWEAPIYNSVLNHSRCAGALVSLPPVSHTYHSMLKHSRCAGAHGSRFRLSPIYIIPCSNILASLRNCALDDIYGAQAKGLHA